MSLRSILIGPAVPAREAGQDVEILGMPLARLDAPALAATLAQRLASGARGMVVFTPDAWAVSRTLVRPRRSELYRKADVVACDSTGLAWGARVLGHPIPRCPGVDLAWHLCDAARQAGLRLYLLGGTPGTAERAARHLVAAHPGLQVVGTHHGYFSGSGPVGDIAALRPDLVFVGMGCPRQENWILAHRQTGGVLLGVGGALDVWAGRYRRAPAWMRTRGLEWIWRAALQPRRAARLWCVPFLGYHIALGYVRCALARQRGPAAS